MQIFRYNTPQFIFGSEGYSLGDIALLYVLMAKNQIEMYLNPLIEPVREFSIAISVITLIQNCPLIQNKNSSPYQTI